MQRARIVTAHGVDQRLLAYALAVGAAFVFVDNLEARRKSGFEWIFGQDTLTKGVDSGDVCEREQAARAHKMRQALTRRLLRNALLKHQRNPLAHVVGRLLGKRNRGDLLDRKSTRSFDITRDQRDEAAREHFRLA